MFCVGELYFYHMYSSCISIISYAKENVVFLIIKKIIFISYEKETSVFVRAPHEIQSSADMYLSCCLSSVTKKN